MTEKQDRQQTLSSQEGLAKSITLITFILMIGVSLLTLFFIPPEGKTPIDNVAMPFVALGAGAAYYLTRQHKYVTGIYSLLGVIVAVATAYALVIDNIGWQTAIGMLVIITGITNGTLAQLEARRISAIAFVFAILIVFTDLFLTGLIEFETTVSSYVITISLAVIYTGLILYRFPQYPLQTKFYIAFFLLSILSVAATTVVISFSVRALLITQIEQQFTNTAGLTSTAFSSALDKQVDLLRTLSFNRVVATTIHQANQDAISNTADLINLDQQWESAAGNPNAPIIERVMKNSLSVSLTEFQRRFPEYTQLIATDKFGAVIAAINTPEDYYQADEGWWQASYNNGTGAVFISQPIVDENTQLVSLEISLPVYVEGSEEVAGILRTTLPLTVFSEAFENGIFGDTGRTEVYMPNNMELEVERHSNGEIEVELEEAPTDFSTTVIQNSTLYDTTHAGIPVFAIMEPLVRLEDEEDDIFAIGNLNWRIVAIQDREEALQGVAITERNAQITGLAVLLFATVLAIVMTQIITRPITRLKEAAEEVSAGNLQVLARIDTTDELGTLGDSFNRMTGQLRESLFNLERRVVERTTDLEIARHQSENRAAQLLAIGEISKVVNSEQNLSNLLPLVTHLVSERFGYYHVGIFLLDDAKQYAVLQAANSEGGQRMLKRIHRLKVGESGIVGFVAGSGTSRIALDVGLDAVFFNNPDLPQTRSEMALPLKYLDATIGVLDVQSEKPGAFTSDDANLLSILADQIAIAIQNAKLFEQTQQTLNEIQALYRQTLQGGWKAYSSQEEMVGYQQSLTGGKKLAQPVNTSEIQQAINRGETLVFHADGKTSEPALAIPIKLRGQVIGVIHIKSPSRDRQWTTNEINLSEAVSERLSLALENARLIQESQQQAIMEQTISDITGRISASINLENVLQTTVEELGRSIPGSEVVIKLTGTGSNNNGNR